MKEFLQSKCSTRCYPSIDDARSIGWIPDHLRLFLSSFIRSELKVEAIGQCLMKAAMPRSVSLLSYSHLLSSLIIRLRRDGSILGYSVSDLRNRTMKSFVLRSGHDRGYRGYSSITCIQGQFHYFCR